MTGSSYATISELAVRYGVSLRTLRFYEQRGLLHPTRAGKVRLYNERDVVRIEVILKGKRLGFSLAEIEALINAQGSDTERPEELLGKADREQIARRVIELEQERLELETAIEELRNALAASTNPRRQLGAVAG